MRIHDLDLDAIQQRNREALSFATEQVGGSEYAPESVMEHFDQDVPELVAEVRRLSERRGYASVRLEKARQAAERLLSQEQNHSGSGRDGHLSEADLVPLFEALGAVYLDDPNAQLIVSDDEA